MNAISDAEEWQKLEIAVDSGASETVVGEDMLPNVQLIEGDMFKRGVKYEAANGELIDNMGEKRFEAHSAEGSVRGLTAQVCGVNKALLSVSKMVKSGNRVVFQNDKAGGSYIEDLQTGEHMYLREEGGMYMLDPWVNGKSSFFSEYFRI